MASRSASPSRGTVKRRGIGRVSSVLTSETFIVRRSRYLLQGKTLNNILKDERGASLAEYILLALIIAVIALIAVRVTGSAADDLANETLPIEFVSGNFQTVEDLQYDDRAYIALDSVLVDEDRRVYVCPSARITTEGDVSISLRGDVGYRVFIPDNFRGMIEILADISCPDGEPIKIDRVSHG